MRLKPKRFGHRSSTFQGSDDSLIGRSGKKVAFALGVDPKVRAILPLSASNIESLIPASIFHLNHSQWPMPLPPQAHRVPELTCEPEGLVTSRHASNAAPRKSPCGSIVVAGGQSHVDAGTGGCRAAQS